MTKKKFNRLSQKWHNETSHLSTMFHVMKHEALREIIEGGESVIPFIIEEMEETLNGHWSSALTEITDCKVIPKHHYGIVESMAKDWIKWYYEIYLSGRNIIKMED